MIKKYYVYKHCRLNCNEDKPFYVGKGCGRRAYEKGVRRSKYWHNIVNKYGLSVSFVSVCLSEEEAFELEVKTILENKKNGFCEANMSNGGDGVRVDKRWWNDKISISMKGRKMGKGVFSLSYKDVITKDELVELYINKGLSTTQIGKIKGVSYGTIHTRLKQCGIEVRGVGFSRKPIICLNDGLEHLSIFAAAKFYNVYRENIRKVLSGKYNHTNNLIFNYKN